MCFPKLSGTSWTLPTVSFLTAQVTSVVVSVRRAKFSRLSNFVRRAKFRKKGEIQQVVKFRKKGEIQHVVKFSDCFIFNWPSRVPNFALKL